MEALAYMHTCVAYEEAAGIECDFPEWEFNWKLPSSAWIGLLATVTAVSILGTTSGAFAISAGRHYVASSSLNVRDCPGGCVVRTLGYGHAVELTGHTSGPWAETVQGNWVYASYLTNHHRVHHDHCYRSGYYSHHRDHYSRHQDHYYSRYYGHRSKPDLLGLG